MRAKIIVFIVLVAIAIYMNCIAGIEDNHSLFIMAGLFAGLALWLALHIAGDLMEFKRPLDSSPDVQLKVSEFADGRQMLTIKKRGRISYIYITKTEAERLEASEILD
jgi:hypothetical protein